MLIPLFCLSSIPIFAQSSMELVSAEKDSTLCFGEIKIVRKNVFDPEIKEENKRLFLWVNKLHFLTKERVIRQELLFKEGDIFDEKLLEESERNLRYLNFLGRVKIEEVKRDHGRVDILVKTQDQWSTTLNLSAQAVGEHYSLEAYFEEHNLLGWGKNLILGYLKTTEGEHRQLSLVDGNIMGTHLLFQTDIFKRSDGHLYNFFFSRPFYSLEVKSAFGIQYMDEVGKINYYQEGKVVFSYQKKNNSLNLELDKSSGKEWKKILGGFYQSENTLNSFYSISDSLKYTEFLPENRELQHFGPLFKLWHPEFKKLTYLENFGRIEDVDLGWHIQGKWGLNLNKPFSKKRTDIASFRFLFPLDLRRNRYLFLSHLTKGELKNQRWEKILSQSETRFYWRTPYWQTLVFRALTISALRHEKGYQLVVGGDNGLRGFEKYRFPGKKALIFNFEDRLFSPWKILTVALGGILFADGGYVWEEKLAGEKLHADVGIGLLFGFTKSYGWRVVRLDFAKSLETNDWVISFGPHLYFELAEM